MKKNTTQQEILLITGTSFCQRQWCEKDASCSNQHLTHREQLEGACWNGLLQELLPGIVEKSADGKNLYLRQILQCESFLEIELCEQPLLIEKEFSIDPYSFLPTIIHN